MYLVNCHRNHGGELREFSKLSLQHPQLFRNSGDEYRINVTMTRNRISIGGIVALVIAAWLSVTMGFWKSDERKFAESTCNPYTSYHQGFEECLVANFGPGTKMEVFRKYIQGSDFTARGKKNEDGFVHYKYVAIKDNEKFDHRIAIFVKAKNGVIVDLKSKQGMTVEGWH